MAKYTDEQIKKAFELCYKDCGGDGACKNCPLQNDMKTCDNLHEYILDLINRQEAEIERLTESLDNLTSWFPTCDGCEGKIEEGARTDKCMYMTDISYCGKKATALYDRLKKQAETARSEAIKDFAERLKKKASQYPYYQYGIACAVSVEDIDNLVKEMLGENK